MQAPQEKPSGKLSCQTHARSASSLPNFVRMALFVVTLFLLLSTWQSNDVISMFGAASLACIVLYLYAAEKLTCAAVKTESDSDFLNQVFQATRHVAWAYRFSDRTLYFHADFLDIQKKCGRTIQLREALRLLDRGSRTSLVRAIRDAWRSSGGFDQIVRLSGRETDGVQIRLVGGRTSDRARLLGVVSVVDREVTASQDSRISNRFMAEVVRAMPLPLTIKNVGGVFVFANQQIEETFGIGRDEIVGMRAGDVFGPDLAEKLDSLDRVVMETGSPHMFEDWFELEHAGRKMFLRVTKNRCTDGWKNDFVVSTYEDRTELRDYAIRMTKVYANIQAFVQRLILTIPYPIYIKSADSRYLTVNEAMADQWNRRVEDMIGRSSVELFGEALGRPMEEEDRRVLAGQPVCKEASFSVGEDGSVRYWAVTKGMCIDVEGNPIVVGANFEITALKQAGIGLRATLDQQTRMRDFLQRLFDAIPNPVILKNEEHQYVMVNKAAAEAYSMTPEKMVGMTTADFNIPDVAAETIEADNRLFSSGLGSAVENEVLVPYGDGKLHRVLLRKVVCLDQNGQRLIMALNNDVTELRGVEADLRSALQRLDALIANAPIGIALIEGNMVFRQINPRFMEMLNHASHDRLPCRFMDVVAPESLAVYDRMICEIRLGEVAHPREMSLLRQDKSVVPVMISAVRSEEADGETAYWIIAADISEQKAAASELIRHRDQLHELVLEQTADLRKAKDAAERANAAKSEFLSWISHELRTPLHAILSFAQLGTDRFDHLPTQKAREYFLRMREGGERLLTLLDELLDLSRLEAGLPGLHVAPCRIGDVFKRVLQEFEALLASRNVGLIQNLDVSLPIIDLDEVRIGQVVRNLLSNAAKFAPAGSVIEFRAAPGPRDVGLGKQSFPTIEFSVSDQGPGIPEGELETVFGKFVQSSRTVGNPGGSGLGLAICREIVVAHGGRILARNREAGGTEFVVSLPLRESDSGCSLAGTGDVS